MGAPSNASNSADGSGTGPMAMPRGLLNPEIKSELTVTPEVVYSPTALLPVLNSSFPEIAMPPGAANWGIKSALTVAPEVVYSPMV